MSTLEPSKLRYRIGMNLNLHFYLEDGVRIGDVHGPIDKVDAIIGLYRRFYGGSGTVTIREHKRFGSQAHAVITIQRTSESEQETS